MWLQGCEKLKILTSYPLLGCFLRHHLLASCFPTFAWPPSWLISDNIFALEEICYFKFLSWEKSTPLSFDNCLGQQRNLKSFPIVQFFLIVDSGKGGGDKEGQPPLFYNLRILSSLLVSQLLSFRHSPVFLVFLLNCAQRRAKGVWSVHCD